MKQNSNIHVFRINRFKKAMEKQQSNANASSTTINSRTSLSAETKRWICEDHNSNPKYTQETLANKYGCKRTTIAKIIKSKERWLSIASDAAIAKRFRQRNSRYPLVENALMLWLDKEQHDLADITDQMLRHQARQYAQSFSVEGSTGSEDFKASSSWVANFRQRYLTPKLTELENRSPKPHVPESTKSKNYHRDVQRNTTVHNFTSVLFVGPPKTHAYTPELGPMSNSLILNRRNGEEREDLVAGSNASSTVKSERMSDLSDEETIDQEQGMMYFADDFDEHIFDNTANEATDVDNQQWPQPQTNSSE